MQNIFLQTSLTDFIYLCDRMETKNIKYDCTRGYISERCTDGKLNCSYSARCAKLSVFNWLDGFPEDLSKDIYEVRFKNTRKLYYKNHTGQILQEGDLVVVEAPNGHDLGIITLSGHTILCQLRRHNIDISVYEFRKIFRKAKSVDLERWQEAIAKEHKTLIRARQIAVALQLNMKIGDVEFQGDGSKAIFYYIADERVDFRQLIKVFAEEFRIRIEMKQIGARQEAGLIGGIGVCGQELCCARFMSEFKSITTQAARTQDLSPNPQKLAGQCSKLKCCINYEAANYLDAHTYIPDVKGPLETEEDLIYLVKTDPLKGIMWFSYDQSSMTNMFPLRVDEVEEIIALNKQGIKAKSISSKNAKTLEFMSAVGEGSISRFNEKRGSQNFRRRGNKGNKNRRGSNDTK